MTRKEKNALLGAIALLGKAVEATPTKENDRVSLNPPEIGPQFDNKPDINSLISEFPISEEELEKALSDIDEAIKTETAIARNFDRATLVLTKLREVLPMAFGLIA